jgi:hypothetical protein
MEERGGRVNTMPISKCLEREEGKVCGECMHALVFFLIFGLDGS